MRSSLVATAAMMLMLVASQAWAQSAAANRQRAKELFRDGVDAYDQGRYDAALTQFQKAHALSHSASLYFNMAACEEHLDHFHSAAVLLRQYLLEKPTAADRGNVELRIQSLEEREAQQRTPRPEPAPPPPAQVTPPVVAPAPIVATPSPPAPVEKKAKLKYTWVLLGVTGAAAVAAVGVGAYTVVHHDDLKKGCGATMAGCSDAQVSGLKSTAIATDVLIGVAAAAAVATVIVGVLEARRGRAHAAAPAGRIAFRDGAVAF